MVPGCCHPKEVRAGLDERERKGEVDGATGIKRYPRVVHIANSVQELKEVKELTQTGVEKYLEVYAKELEDNIRLGDMRG